MRRRAVLAGMAAAVALPAAALTPDRPDVLLIADEEVGYDQTVTLARALAGVSGLRVKPVLPLPLADAAVNEKGQVIAERLLAQVANGAERLRRGYDAPRALVIVLIARDMNGADGSTHYVFTQGYADPPLTAISLARLHFSGGGRGDAFEARAVKMLLRTVGLQLWHVPRSGDPRSVMFSPLTSIEDLDAMGTELKRPE